MLIVAEALNTSRPWSILLGVAIVLIWGVVISAIWSAAILRLAGTDRENGRLSKESIRNTAILAIMALALCGAVFALISTANDSYLWRFLLSPWN